MHCRRDLGCCRSHRHRPKLKVNRTDVARRTAAHLLGMNKNTVQRTFQYKGWQVRKRPVGFRPRIQALPSVAKAPHERWATGLCRVWAGKDGWTSLALLIDCHTPELLGWHHAALKTEQHATPCFRIVNLTSKKSVKPSEIT